MSLLNLRKFKAQRLTAAQQRTLARLAARTRSDALEMISRGGSGHPGGALSSLDIYLLLWLCADVAPDATQAPGRDRIVVSHGHTSAGLYATLGNLGYFPLADVLAQFRQAGTPYEGHPNSALPGVEWGSGALGQGLSVGCGFALASRLERTPFHVYVVMGDGEQQKGQIAEARTFAAAHGLGNLTAIVDCNQLQATGAVADVMPQQLADLYRASGWDVLRAKGHDFDDLYRKLRGCRATSKPTVILADTIMGKGVSFMEHKYRFHGAVLSAAEQQQALAELGKTAQAFARRGAVVRTHKRKPVQPVETTIHPGARIVYPAGKVADVRAAWGNAITDLVARNKSPLAVLDCDLGPSVKTDAVRDKFPARFVQCGIQEHHTATLAAALSRAGVLTFWADFGVFALDEVYSQLRMADMNHTSMKIIATHCGLDVGADGKTHQCIDYIGLTAHLMNFKLIVPADANQMDAAVRYVATTPGNFIIACGRSAWPVIEAQKGQPYFGTKYTFQYGQVDWLATGRNGVILATGAMVHKALETRQLLSEKGVQVGVVNIACPHEIDRQMLRRAARTGRIFVFEDHHRKTGLGVSVAAACAEQGLHCAVRCLGIGRYGGSGQPGELYAEQGLDPRYFVKTIENS